MMKRYSVNLGEVPPMKKLLDILFVFLLLFLCACGPTGSAVDGGTTSNPAEATAALQTEVARIVGATQAAQTQMAGMAAATAAVETEIANAVASTLTAVVTDTPEFTLTPSLTSTPLSTATMTLTPTPNYPRVTVSANTNCRSGPGLAYEILGSFKAGETAEVVGRDFNQGYWVIRLPSEPIIICWIWRYSATPMGETISVPIFTPQPTPTEIIGFSLTYEGFTSCSGLYYIKFKIENNSNETWESNQVNATDRTTNVTTTINRDHFSNYDGCNLIGNDTNLDPGEVGITTSNGFTSNPTGHDFKATIQVCSLEGQSGTCATKTITFTP
jgi:hypothetical protein